MYQVVFDYTLSRYEKYIIDFMRIISALYTELLQITAEAHLVN